MITYYDIAESALSGREFVAESLYYCTDTGNIYIDSILEGSRVQVGKDIAILPTENARTSLLTPIPYKLYCVLESGFLYVFYEGEWCQLGGGSGSASRPQIHISNVLITNESITVQDSRILSTDTAVFIPDLSVADLVSDINVTCANGSVTVSLTSIYNIVGEIIVN